MDITIDQVDTTDDEQYRPWADAFARALHEPWEDPARAAFRHFTLPGRSYAARAGGDVVGTACDFGSEITMPGGATVPFAAVTGVGVLPTHRRQGALRRMMSQQLHDIRDRGEVIAGLGATEAVIYGRFGYGITTEMIRHKVRATNVPFHRAFPTTGTFRYLSTDPDAFAAEVGPIFADHAASQHGEIARPDLWWRCERADPPEWRDGEGPLQHVLYRDVDGVAQGYASYAVKSDWTESQPDGTCFVKEVVARDPDAEIALWRWLLDLDLVTSIMALVPVESPFRFLFANRRHVVSLNRVDALWTRLVDVPTALTSRTYLVDGDLVVEVHDPVLVGNTGRWNLRVRDGAATCERTDAVPQLKIDVADLASLTFGGYQPSTLADARRIDVGDAAGLALADRLFPTPRLPVALTDF